MWKNIVAYCKVWTKVEESADQRSEIT